MEKILKQLKELVNKVAMESLSKEYTESYEEKLLAKINHIRTYEDLANNELIDLFNLFKYLEDDETNENDNSNDYNILINLLEKMNFKNVYEFAYFYTYLYSLRFTFPTVYDYINNPDEQALLDDEEYLHYLMYQKYSQDFFSENKSVKEKTYNALVEALKSRYSVTFLHLYCLIREQRASELDIKLNRRYRNMIFEAKVVNTGVFQLIKNAKKKYVEDKDNFNKKMIKITRSLKDFYVYLNSIKENEIIDISKLDTELLSLKDAQYIIEYVIKYNEQIFDKEIQSYTNYINDKYTVFKNIFKKYNFDFTKYTYDQQEYLMNTLEMNDLFELLEIINELFHKNTIPMDMLFYILKESDIKDLQSIATMHINPEFLLNNYTIFNKGILNNVHNNVQLFKEKEIKWRREENKNNPVILVDNSFLSYNIKLLELYRKNMKDKELTNFDYLKNEDYIINIERLIELGIEQKEINKIINNPAISVKHLTLLVKRLLIEKELGSNNITEDYWLEDEVLDEFIINDINDYIDNDTNNIINSSYQINISGDNPYITILDKEYKIDNYRYNINGINISRNKVIRNISKLNKEVLSNNELLTILIHNSVLNTYEIEIVKESITKLFNTNILKR